MKSVVLVLAVIVAVAAAQPAYYQQTGSYRSLGANFGFDIPLPRLPGVQLQAATLALPVPTLRQSFFNIPLPRIEFQQNNPLVRKPHHGSYH